MRFAPSMLLPDMRVVQTAVTATAPSAARILGPNPDRVCVLFWPTQGGSYVVGPSNIVTQQRGWTVASGSSIISFDFATWGHIITGEWWAAGSAASVATYVTELIYQPRKD